MKEYLKPEAEVIKLVLEEDLLGTGVDSSTNTEEYDDGEIIIAN